MCVCVCVCVCVRVNDLITGIWKLDTSVVFNVMSKTIALSGSFVQNLFTIVAFCCCCCCCCFRMGYFFSTYRSKAVPLLQYFFLIASVVSGVVFVCLFFWVFFFFLFFFVFLSFFFVLFGWTGKGWLYGTVFHYCDIFWVPSVIFCTAFWISSVAIYFNNSEFPIISDNIINIFVITAWAFNKIMSDLNIETNTSVCWDCMDQKYFFIKKGRIRSRVSAVSKYRTWREFA